MAKLIQGIGMSHSPMMAMEGEYWQLYTKRDFGHKLLFDEEGNHVSYDDLEKQRDSRYIEEAKPEKLKDLYEEMVKGFAKLKRDVSNASPDVMVVIANDHPGEFFDGTNIPALGIFYDDKIISVEEKTRMEKLRSKSVLDHNPEAFTKAATEMGMEKNNVWPGSSKVGKHLIESLMTSGFDVSALKEPKDPIRYGHGHGYGMVVRKVMEEDNIIPMVPIYLNIIPPNVISPSRSYDLGRSLRKAIETFPEDIKITLVASGGLSHFVTDVGIDEQVLTALRNRSEEALRNLPVKRLNAGSAEIRNWVVLAGATEHLRLDWDKYVPIFRTPAGTGIGMTFANWS